MPFSLEQDMIRALNNCIKTSELKTKKHTELKYFSLEVFSSEFWSLSTRNEGTSELKRRYLGELIADLTRSHNFHVERGQALDKTFALIPSSASSSSSEPVMTKSPIAIKSEINLQMSQFRALQAYLTQARSRIDATISLTAAGGESLKALEECETILKAGITRWIMQMQQNNYHTNGIFPQHFQPTPTRSEGTLFEGYVRELMRNRIEIPTGEALDPNNKHPAPVLQLDVNASGVFETASLVGSRAAALADPIEPMTRDASTQVDPPGVDSSASNIVSFSQPSFLGRVGLAASAPPAYPDSELNSAVNAAQNGDGYTVKPSSSGGVF